MKAASNLSATSKTKSKVLPETVGEPPSDPVGDLIRQAQGQRGLSLKKASKEMGSIYKKSGIYSAKAPTVSQKSRKKAVKEKSKAPGDFYNRGQRVSKNIEDYTTADGSPSSSVYGDAAFFKHTQKDNCK